MGRRLSASRPRVIAAFDFDGTITTRDTLPVFIWFSVKILRIITGTLSVFPYLLLFKLKLIANFTAKEKLFRAFYSGVRLAEFNQAAAKFADQIEKLINPQALARIKWHQKMGHEVIIISASAENWIKPWAEKYKISTVLATQLEENNMVLTGNFLTKNCHGDEKVARLLEKFPDRENYVLYAYGDSRGDKELLELADHSFYRSFPNEQ